MRASPRWYGLFGGLLALLGIGVLTVFRASGGTAVQAGLFTLAGVFTALVGFDNPVRERVGWNRLVGAGYVLLGVSLPVGAVSSDASGAVYWVLLVATTVGGGSLALIGFDFARGGRWFDVPDSLD